jgi:YfiH family protein
MIWYGRLLSQRSSVLHGFTGKRTGSGESLDLGSGRNAEAWAAAARAIGAAGWPVAWLQQVHGDRVRQVSVPGLQGEGDALVTEEHGVLLAIRTADCLPILVAGDGIVAAIHAGWRGLGAGIVEATLRVLENRGPLVAVVGPAICGTCYEVGKEVVDVLAGRAAREVFVTRERHVDLGALAVHILERAGVGTERIAVCTRCGVGLHSHRRDGEAAGRQAGFVGLR